MLEDVSFVIHAGERAALIGPNGCGKSTLIRIIAGAEQPDRGSVVLAPGSRLGWLPQDMRLAPGIGVGDAVRAGLGEWDELREELDRLSAQMATARGSELDRAMVAYDSALARFQALGGYEVDHQVQSMLARLDLGDLDPQVPMDRLSGGEATRVGLAAVLISGPNIVLLDEPTNHLDIDALLWLEEWLTGFQGAVLFVSHDRAFLEKTASKVLELEDGRVTEYRGAYDDYAEEKAAESARQWSVWKDQQAEIRRITQDIQHTKMQAKRVEITTTSRQPGVRRYAKKVAKKALSREKKLERYLKSDALVEKPEQRWYLKLNLADMPRSGTDVIRLSGLGHRFDRWLYRDVSLILRHGDRAALLGSNGSGKSTLLRSIVGEIQPMEGTARIGSNVRLGYMPQMQEALDPHDSPLALIRRLAPLSETEARNFLHYFLFAGDEVFLPMEKLSLGERSLLLLAKLVAEGANCLVLDEPVNHLDIPSRERFEAALDAFPGAILAAVHDRAFIDRFATAIWSLEHGTVRRYQDRQEMLRLSPR